MTNKEKKILKERLELVLPKDISFGIANILHGTEGMVISSNSIELLEKDSEEFKLFMGGVERSMRRLKMTEVIFENVKSLSRSVASGEIPDISFQYKLDDYFSIPCTSITLLTGIDYWDIIWKGFSYHYYSMEINGRYDEYYSTCNKIHFMTKVKGSKYNINDITLEDINNYSMTSST